MKIMDECWNETTTKWTSLRKFLAQRTLENDLAGIVRTVAGHKKNNVPRGASQYLSLYNVAEIKVNEFCRRYRIDRSDIEAQIPALKELQDLATAPKIQSRVLPTLITLVAVICGVYLLGMLTGLGQWIFDIGYHTAAQAGNLLRAL